MAVYMIYLTWGPFLWAGQILVALSLMVAAGLAFKSNDSKIFQRALHYSKFAAVLALIFTILMSPVALMVALRRHDSMYATQWTDPIGLACIGQLLIFLASWALFFSIRRKRIAHS